MSGLERYLEPVRVGGAFWAGLAADDDDALEPLLSPTWDRPTYCFGAAYREARGLAGETCRFLGLATHAELVTPSRVRFRYSITDRVLYFEAATPMTVWRLELVEIDGRWFVDRTSDDPPIERIDLGPLFPDLEPRPPPSVQ